VVNPPATPAATPGDLHPRYQRVWESAGADWPVGEPFEVDVHLHDFTDRRWLTPQHAAGLVEGTLNVPDRANFDHPAVLVSVPQRIEGCPVAWVDRDLAEAVLYAHRLGVRLEESCQDVHHAAADYWPRLTAPTAFLWVRGRRDLRHLHDQVADVAPSTWHWTGLTGPASLLPLPSKERSLALPATDVPALTSRLKAALTGPTAHPRPHQASSGRQHGTGHDQGMQADSMRADVRAATPERGPR